MITMRDKEKLYLWIVMLVKFAIFSWLAQMKTYFNVFNFQLLWYKKICNNFQKKDCNINHSHKKLDFYGPYSRLRYFWWLWINYQLSWIWILSVLSLDWRINKDNVIWSFETTWCPLWLQVSRLRTKFITSFFPTIGLANY